MVNTNQGVLLTMTTLLSGLQVINYKSVPKNALGASPELEPPRSELKLDFQIVCGV